MKTIVLRERWALAVLLWSAAIVTSCGYLGLAHGQEKSPPEKRPCESPTHCALLSLPVHYTDKDEEERARWERLLDLSEVITGATERPLRQAVLVILAWHESRLARYVYEDRCSDGPAGELECDQGRARGPFQLQDSENYTVPGDHAEQAKRAIGVWLFGLRRCRKAVKDALAGAFSSYGSGGHCAPSKSSKARARHVRYLLGRFWG